MARPVRPDPPSSLDTQCPTCRCPTEHDVLSGTVIKGGLGVEGTFRCTVCETVHKDVVRFPTPLAIPLIVSYDERSEPASVEVPENEVLEIGDEFEVGDERIELTGIELKDQARRTTRARAPDIATLWGKNIDRVKVKFGLNEGDETLAFESWFGPEDEVRIGDTFELEDQEVFVERIVTDQGSKERGAWNVRGIKRVWLRRPGPRRPVDRSPPARASRGAGQRPPRSPGGRSGPEGRPRHSGGAPRAHDARGRRPAGASRTGGAGPSQRPRGGAARKDGGPTQNRDPGAPAGRSGPPGIGSSGGRPGSRSSNTRRTGTTRGASGRSGASRRPGSRGAPRRGPGRSSGGGATRRGPARGSKPAGRGRGTSSKRSRRR